MSDPRLNERIEAACNRFYAPSDPTGWVAPPTLTRNMRNALEAAGLPSLLEENERLRATITEHKRRWIGQEAIDSALEGDLADAQAAARAFAKALMCISDGSTLVRVKGYGDEAYRQTHREVATEVLAAYPGWLSKEGE